jgi:hypothetical protein
MGWRHSIPFHSYLSRNRRWSAGGLNELVGSGASGAVLVPGDPEPTGHTGRLTRSSPGDSLGLGQRPPRLVVATAPYRLVVVAKD